jgi:hypothetical protein
MRLVMPRLDVILDAAIMTESAGNKAQRLSDSGVRPLPCGKRKTAAACH